jgi:hypothetical protein
MERRGFQWPLLRTHGVHIRFAFFAVAIIVFNVCGVADGQTNTSTTITTHTRTPSDGACPAVTGCLNDSMCSNCLKALNSSISAVEANSAQFQLRLPQTQFFSDLIGSTCSNNGTVVPLLAAAVSEINSRPCFAIGRSAPVSDQCLKIEFHCALFSECRQCITGIYTADNNKTSALNSSSCLALGNNGFSLQDLSVCAAFPKCTWAKQQCEDDVTHKCTNCLNMLHNGDVANAVQECSPSMTGNSSALLDNVANSLCMYGTDIACSYLEARCSQDAVCGSC